MAQFNQNIKKTEKIYTKVQENDESIRKINKRQESLIPTQYAKKIRRIELVKGYNMTNKTGGTFAPIVTLINQDEGGGGVIIG